MIVKHDGDNTHKTALCNGQLTDKLKADESVPMIGDQAVWDEDLGHVQRYQEVPLYGDQVMDGWPLSDTALP